ncbi:class I SAM-dependent methyltransferase [Kiloniella laminariae]|uniref:class I SAM-dependent methyltransferase n=1 Tax=Kiloniella laminariae TaxID=454162 RepID=UPI000381385B|nr:class I SAM-dependent methyltransferase [Kiloniella laminariae]
MTDPSPWVLRFAPCIRKDSTVLDLACGSGRHARLFLMNGHYITALDKNTENLADIKDFPGVEVIKTDLEDGSPFPLAGRKFGGVIVTNYLHRPLLPLLSDLLEPEGILIYETFMQGNEKFGRPNNPDFLLRSQELLESFRNDLIIKAYEEEVLSSPKPAVVQRICAVMPQT